MVVDTESRCISCGKESTGISPTGHPVCADCQRKHGPKDLVLARLLSDVQAHLERFVVFPNSHGSLAVTLWIATSHIVDTLDVAPYLLVTAPEIESGKTRLIEVTAPLVPKPMFSSSMTPAVLFRTIDELQPTLFLDEADNVWSKHGDEKNQELVALLNAGHRRGIPARRMGGPGKTTLQEFDVFCMKCVAGAFPDVSKIPEALRSRSIHLRMQRKLPGENVTRWTRQAREVWLPQLGELRDELADILETVHPVDVRIDPPDELGDRDFDVWEPLLQVAHRAGQLWFEAAIDAAIAMSRPEGMQTTPPRLLVLRDVRDVWNGESFMLTSDILKALHELEERPWSDYYGKPLSAHKLARFLSSYDIESRYEPGEKRRKGYYRQDLEDLWLRYSSESSQSAQTSQEADSERTESIERSLQTETGTYDSDRCRCGSDVEHFTPAGIPYCEDCGEPE